jgi:hypothetical protein
MENEQLNIIEDELEESTIDSRWITPYKLMKRYFSKLFFEKIVDFTNLYAEKKLNEITMKKYSHFKNWKSVTLQEIKVFIGLIIIMGIYKNCWISDHWSKNEFQNSNFNLYMTYSRFKLISSFFHLSEPDAEVFDKVNLIQKRFNAVSPKLYQLSKNLTVDENLYPFKKMKREFKNAIAFFK